MTTSRGDQSGVSVAVAVVTGVSKLHKHKVKNRHLFRTLLITRIDDKGSVAELAVPIARARGGGKPPGSDAQADDVADRKEYEHFTSNLTYPLEVGHVYAVRDFNTEIDKRKNLVPGTAVALSGLKMQLLAEKLKDGTYGPLKCTLVCYSMTQLHPGDFSFLYSVVPRAIRFGKSTKHADAIKALAADVNKQPQLEDTKYFPKPGAVVRLLPQLVADQELKALDKSG